MWTKEQRSDRWKEYYQLNQERLQARSREWYHVNKDKIDKEKKKVYLHEYYLKNKSKYKHTPEQHAKYNENRKKKYAEDVEHREKLKAQVKAWNSKNPLKKKSQHLREYNLTLDQFNSLMDRQGHSCAICGLKDNGNKKIFPFVDHNHQTGKVRGLLCVNCNHGIGKFKDNPALLMAAITYLNG